MGDMLSIGDVAHRTGVSRRMLRHWEELGLLEPATVEPATGYRRYAPSQVGRVRTVADLRALGFGLEAIAEVLDPALTADRLVTLLRAREQDLVAQADEAARRLVEVRRRLSAVEDGRRTVTETLELTALPALRLAAARATVRDETEIPLAAARLRATVGDRLAARGTQDVEIVLLFDGSADDAIVVTVGYVTDAGDADGLDEVPVPAVPQGVSVRFDEPPLDVSDAWIALDDALAGRGLRTTGTYRQVVSPDGAVTLQAACRRAAPRARA